jgi:hypothetical protein
MSAKVIPWPTRTAVAAGNPVNYLPALIDRQVPVRALRKALVAAGLRLEHDPITGNLFILADSATPAQHIRADGRAPEGYC